MKRAWRRRSSLLAVISFVLLTGFSSRTLAHDGEWGDINTPTEVDWIGDIASLTFDHNDADPWKGWAGIWLKNICGSEWGDFHFQIRSCYGSDVNNVKFLVDPEPELWVVTAPYTLEQVDITWNVNNDANNGATLDLFFYDNPIQVGDIVKFRIYTDNTYFPHASWFTVSGYPTPVPEPTSVVLLGIGSLSLLRRRKR